MNRKNSTVSERENQETMLSQGKEKPVVKYRTHKFRFCGEMCTTRSKLTLLASFEGEQAKKIYDASHAEGLYWSYWDTKGKEKLEIYEDKTLWSKP